MLRHAYRASSRRAHYQHPAPGRFVQVNIVHPHACAPHHAKLRRFFHQLRRHLCRTPHDQRVRVGQFPRQRLLGRKNDIPSCLFQQFDTALADLVRNDDFHVSSFPGISRPRAHGGLFRLPENYPNYCAVHRLSIASRFQNPQFWRWPSAIVHKGELVMNLSEQIQKDIVTAMKAKEELRLSVLRMVKAAIQLKEVEKMRPLEHAEGIQLLQTLLKQRKESIDQFAKGGRQDLVDKETRELAFIEAYLPAGASEAEMDAAVTKAIADSGAT